jgi:hypothetical protein
MRSKAHQYELLYLSLPQFHAENVNTSTNFAVKSIDNENSERNN